MSSKNDCALCEVTQSYIYSITTHTTHFTDDQLAYLYLENHVIVPFIYLFKLQCKPSHFTYN